ncbi:MAG: HIT family protein, partial [Clostridia bacterium]|nr:HIT family protein [Clostridia bacterium]
MFCDIAAHKAAAYIVNETEKTISFLDIDPANEGHMLIIPKLHVDSITELPDDYVLKMTEVARHAVRSFRKVYN